MVRVTTTDPTPFYLRFGVADELSPNGFQQPPAQRPAGQPATCPTRASATGRR